MCYFLSLSLGLCLHVFLMSLIDLRKQTKNHHASLSWPIRGLGGVFLSWSVVWVPAVRWLFPVSWYSFTLQCYASMLTPSWLSVECLTEQGASWLVNNEWLRGEAGFALETWFCWRQLVCCSVKLTLVQVFEPEPGASSTRSMSVRFLMFGDFHCRITSYWIRI